MVDPRCKEICNEYAAQTKGVRKGGVWG